MNKLIQDLPAVQDADLMVCYARGVAYQRDMTAGKVEYGDAYLAKVCGYEHGEIARRVNEGRCAMLRRHLPPCSSVLDIGAGSGAFMRAATVSGYTVRGFDVIPAAVERLRHAGLYGNQPQLYDAVTLWDTIEHLEEPAFWLEQMRHLSWLFISIPVFADIRRVRESKHYRPGEHLYYWTDGGFVGWISHYGFRLIERSAHETEAGRESIGAFAFRRDLPPPMTNH
jgi:hypothetical protein